MVVCGNEFPDISATAGVENIALQINLSVPHMLDSVAYGYPNFFSTTAYDSDLYQAGCTPSYKFCNAADDCVTPLTRTGFIVTGGNSETPQLAVDVSSPLSPTTGFVQITTRSGLKAVKEFSIETCG